MARWTRHRWTCWRRWRRPLQKKQETRDKRQEARGKRQETRNDGGTCRCLSCALQSALEKALRILEAACNECNECNGTGYRSSRDLLAWLAWLALLASTAVLFLGWVMYSAAGSWLRWRPFACDGFQGVPRGDHSDMGWLMGRGEMEDLGSP
ncbi:hypothetical protein N431DRAFT_451022 [Stipitochalara longipes BDJ]|nr:hypothetical protein N431DRAFT_451022 [Stipitochalara longipes BDJ]